jgi:hypothetical protein
VTSARQGAARAPGDHEGQDAAGGIHARDGGQMAPLRIFVGYEDRQAIAYEVLKYSLEKHSSSPLDIRPLRLRTLAEAIGFKRPHDPLQSTEFTYTRFLVPFLCDFKGSALYLDSDMLCLGDITELFELDLSTYWLRVVKHDYHPTTRIKMGDRIQTDYPRKNWSSLMLLLRAAHLLVQGDGGGAERPLAPPLRAGAGRVHRRPAEDVERPRRL